MAGLGASGLPRAATVGIGNGIRGISEGRGWDSVNRRRHCSMPILRASCPRKCAGFCALSSPCLGFVTCQPSAVSCVWPQVRTEYGRDLGERSSPFKSLVLLAIPHTAQHSNLAI